MQNNMGLHVAFVSGGKDSYYAVYRYGGRVDVGIVLIYEFPRPSPHIVNIGKSIETLLLSGLPIVVVKLNKNREFSETAEVLRKLDAEILIAGDVYVEEHLNYMEKLAKEVSATLIEPLWGYDPLELIYKEFESGIRSVVIGCINPLDKWLGVELTVNNISNFVEEAINLGIDPLGERGEYHTVVVHGPLHKTSMSYKVIEKLTFDDYSILRIV
ncbi:MAG: ATPase [Desulfurococcaceae archaeon]